MAKPRKTLKQTKVKKKRWVPIVSPKFMGGKSLGETYLQEPESAVGRAITVNLMQITGDAKSQSSSVSFDITSYKDNKLVTSFSGYDFSPATIKRFVRRRMTRIDASLVLNTKDNVKIRIKPFVLTRERVSRSVEYSMRSKLIEEITKIVNKTVYEELVHMILNYRLQKELRDPLNKIYPIRTMEIRVLKRLSAPKREEPEEEAEKEETKPEKKAKPSKKPEAKAEKKEPAKPKTKKTKAK